MENSFYAESAQIRHSLSPSKAPGQYSPAKPMHSSPTRISQRLQSEVNAAEKFHSSQVMPIMSEAIQHMLHLCPTEVDVAMADFFEAKLAGKEIEQSAKVHSNEKKKATAERASDLVKIISINVVKERPDDILAHVVKQLKAMMLCKK